MGVSMISAERVDSAERATSADTEAERTSEREAATEVTSAEKVDLAAVTIELLRLLLSSTNIRKSESKRFTRRQSPKQFVKFFWNWNIIRAVLCTFAPQQNAEYFGEWRIFTD